MNPKLKNEVMNELACVLDTREYLSNCSAGKIRGSQRFLYEPPNKDAINCHCCTRNDVCDMKIKGCKIYEFHYDARYDCVTINELQRIGIM